MNIAGVLEERARRSPERPAIIERNRTIGFGELDRAVASAAADLARAGVRAGMRVLVVSPMSVDLYTVMIALFRLRAIAVFVDASRGRDRLNQSIERVKPAAFVAVPRAHFLRFTSRAIGRIPIKATIGGRIPDAASVARGVRAPGRPVEPCGPDTPAIITFTSGSTGEPKATVRTHGVLLAQHRALTAALALSDGEVDLCTLPIFLLGNLASGVTSVIPDADLRAVGSIDPVPVDAQIRAHRPVRTVASPAFLARLTTHARTEGRPYDSFERIFTGGAPVFPSTLDDIASVAPRARVVAVYGSTEAEPIAEIARDEISPADREAMAHGAGLLAGTPVPSVQVRILPDCWERSLGPWSAADFDAKGRPARAPGEIVVTGDHVLRGYLDGRGDADTKIHVDESVWHRTGDAGYIDDRGRLWLLGRCEAKVSDAHGVVYPFAVEAAASGTPGLTRAAFVLHNGRRVLVAEVSGDAAATKRRLLGRLAWARIAEVAIVPLIPLDARHNAKIDYPALRRMLGS